MCLPAKVLEGEEKVVRGKKSCFLQKSFKGNFHKAEIKSNDEVTVKPEISRKNNEMKVKTN